MTLSEDARAELVRWEVRRDCCRLAELSGLARGAGTFHLHSGGRVGLHLDLTEPAVARRAFSLLKSFDAPAELRKYSRGLQREGRLQLHVDDSPRALQTLEEAGVIDATLAPRPFPPSRITRRACCRASYLRGVFLSAGSASGPRHAHLELRVASEASAEHLADLARGDDVPLSVRDRDRSAIAYTKSVENMTDFLALIGAAETALVLREASVVATTRGDANRRANGDHANLVRASRAAHAQLDAIRRLRSTGRFAELSSELEEAARLRVDNPIGSIRELAELTNPPTTKVTMQRRLQKLRRLAEG
ncbi:MAG: DNA-binding protein WhiA [Gaiellaceae bacterium]